LDLPIFKINKTIVDNPLDAHSSSQFTDPIIEKILSERDSSSENVSTADEAELRKRMYTMIKYSKKYRRLATQEAYQKWDVLYSIDQEIFFNATEKHVSFSENVEVIPILSSSL
jgi:hypothetical protein